MNGRARGRGGKTPYFVQRKDEALFAFGALWEHWMGADGSELETAILMTIAPNAELSQIHERMPVIIAPADFETWLTGEAEDARKLIRPAPEGSFKYEVTEFARRTPAPERPVDRGAEQLKLF